MDTGVRATALSISATDPGVTSTQLTGEDPDTTAHPATHDPESAVVPDVYG